MNYLITWRYRDNAEELLKHPVDLQGEFTEILTFDELGEMLVTGEIVVTYAIKMDD